MREKQYDVTQCKSASPDGVFTGPESHLLIFFSIKSTQNMKNGDEVAVFWDYGELQLTSATHF